MGTTIGYNKELFILPFDHRGSFQEKLFGIKGRAPTEEETKTIAGYKDIIFQGYLKALGMGVQKAQTGILVDEQFGMDILKGAAAQGITTACPAEKSGQDEFDFEFGAEFGAHIEKCNPSFVKVLVRLNPESDAEMNARQTARLKKLSDYCHANNRKFMFELLVPATTAQLAKFSGDTSLYDKNLRPSLMVTAMKYLQDHGVEADVWKLEGVETKEDCIKVANQAREGAHRKDVGVILLGRGENAEKVKHWLKTAASVPGLIGFAVGRTVFWEPLKAVKEGRMTREEASTTIANTFKGFCELWVSSK